MPGHKHFFQAITKQPLSAALLLANLLDQPTQMALISEKLTGPELQRLTSAIVTMPDDKKAILDPLSVVALNRVLAMLLQDNVIASKLPITAINLLARDEAQARWALYRLVQKHNPSLQIPPGLLSDFGSQSVEQVGLYYQHTTLPVQMVADLVSSEACARLVLQDLYANPSRYTLTEQLIAQYPALACEVAQSWQAAMEVRPMAPNEKASLLQVSAKLAKKHPEFKVLDTVKRRKRTLEAQSEPQLSSHWQQTVSAAWLAINLPSASTVVHTVHYAVRGLAPVSPVSIGLSALMVTGRMLLPFAIYHGTKRLKEESLPLTEVSTLSPRR